MLEKIGLPAKPALRGNNWVTDASHCQGCSSQFTFINRKHHCRRCGGLFCNSCTQQRMVLRGQGDSPVRICEPCKKLEEAARFEMRHGNRSRTARGSSKFPLKNEDEVLKQILSNDGKDALPSGLGSNSDIVSSIPGASSSNNQEVVTQDGVGEVNISPIDEQHLKSEMGTASPEELRQQALDEKKKYKVLKGEGKSDEALKAFKRGKELERQADALELHLRKNRRKALLSGNAEVDTKESERRNKAARLEGKDKDDLAAELVELGWSDMDLQNEDKKPATMSLEGELSSLLGEISGKTKKDKAIDTVDKTQVVALKRKALALKREGKLAEAKEELKRAKILEKQLEEQELLGDAEESDDELSALIHSMDNEKLGSSSNTYDEGRDFDFGSLMGAADDHIIDGNFEVTDDDMEDPEMAAALKSLGWTEDSGNHESTVDKESLSNEILSLKREALSQKRAGNVAEAMELLKKAKMLERDLETFESPERKVGKDPTRAQKNTTSQAADQSSKSYMVGVENINEKKEKESRIAQRSRFTIQKELLALKKKALTLRREGRLAEAEEELKKGKILEHQLEEMDSASKVKTTSMDFSNEDPGKLPIGNKEEEDVTDQDLSDPTYLSLLRNLGWKDEENEQANLSSESHERNDNPPMRISESSATKTLPSVSVGRSKRSKAEMQRELLGLKRNALALRRRGENEEAEEVLRKARTLEAQIAEMEDSTKEIQSDTRKENIKTPLKISEESDAGEVTENDMHDPAMLSILKNLGLNVEEQETVTADENRDDVAVNLIHSDGPSLTQSSPAIFASQKSKGEIQRELLNLKRKALTLRRKGETEEVEEVLKMAKVLEAQMEELQTPKQIHLLDASKIEKSEDLRAGKHGNIIDAVDTSRGMNQETLGSNTKVLDFPTFSGSMVSYEANHPPRKSDILGPLDSQLSQGDQLIDLAASSEIGPSAHTGAETKIIPPPGDSVNLIDLLTGDNWIGSQASAKKQTDGLSCSGGSFLNSLPVQSEIVTISRQDLAKKDDIKSEKRENIVLIDEKPPKTNYVEEHASHKNDALRQDILARKRKAVGLKREGKLAEAREELRQAKLLEKQLEKDNAEPKSGSTSGSVSTSSPPIVQKERGSSDIAPKTLSSRERFKLQQESLSHKRQAMKLRREGRTDEADHEFELAKALEAQLEESSGHDSNAGIGSNSDVGVEDFLDPQLLSALKAIGIDNGNVKSQVPERPQPSKLNVDKGGSPNKERTQLEEQIKAEKVKAVNLKRSGKQAEALDALRNAKLLEKKLNSIA
ncbi:hypothetical protein UlMin_004663 [Ulmus minor]